MYIDKESEENELRYKSVVEKGRRVLEKYKRSNKTNMISKNFMQLEKSIEDMNINRLMAEASV
jgi:ApbE superfamily uncharacterized protein (UPF0280 family)